MNQIERYAIIDKIGRHLQATMTTTDINVFLGGFGIQHSGERIVSSKWVYVKSLLSNAETATILRIARELNIDIPNNVSIGSTTLHGILKTSALSVCEEDFNRALRDVKSDSAQAIGNAATTLESICKAILDELNVPYPNDESLQPLLKIVFDKMNLSPDAHADAEIKRILGGLFNVGAGLAVIRTKYSSFHGKGSKQLRLGERHARLAVHSLATVGIFLLETYKEKYGNS